MIRRFIREMKTSDRRQLFYALLGGKVLGAALLMLVVMGIPAYFGAKAWADDAPLPPVDGQLPTVPPDAVWLREFGEQWGLGSSLSRFLSAVSRI